MCLTNFLPTKTAYKRTICTFPIVICQRHKRHNLQVASLIHLPAQNIMRRVDSLALRKCNGETSSGCFAVSFFGELAKGSKGVELPCKFRMCPDRVHPVQNGMPFCETCLSSPPRFRQFLRDADVGKAASERALLFPHPFPKKSSKPSGG